MARRASDGGELQLKLLQRRSQTEQNRWVMPNEKLDAAAAAATQGQAPTNQHIAQTPRLLSEKVYAPEPLRRLPRPSQVDLSEMERKFQSIRDRLDPEPGSRGNSQPLQVLPRAQSFEQPLETGSETPRPRVVPRSQSFSDQRHPDPRLDTSGETSQPRLLVRAHSHYLPAAASRPGGDLDPVPECPRHFSAGFANHVRAEAASLWCTARSPRPYPKMPEETACESQPSEAAASNAGWLEPFQEIWRKWFPEQVPALAQESNLQRLSGA